MNTNETVTYSKYGRTLGMSCKVPGATHIGPRTGHPDYYTFYCSKCDVTWEGNKNANDCPECRQYCSGSSNDLSD